MAEQQKSGASGEGSSTPQTPVVNLESDGSVTRVPSPLWPDVPPNPVPDPEHGVSSKDVILDHRLNLWVRLFLPHNQSSASSSTKVIVYFHGGGFTIASAATAQFHTWCTQISSKLSCIVISVNYRLAPEHRLPAAYEDGYSVLRWLDNIRASSNAESWLTGADFTRIFVAGDSAGGNLAHHVAVHAAELHKAGELSFKFAGQILLQPFFGGVERTESEVELGQGEVLTTEFSDKCWKLALPEGADRGHAFCDTGRVLREVVKKVGDGFVGKTMVMVGGMDLLKDRQVEYARVLEEEGGKVKLVVYPNAGHGFYVFPGSTETPQTPLLLDELVSFCG